MSIFQEAQNLKETIVAHRRHLHRIPEVGLDLPETSRYVEEQLQRLGYETKRIGSSGIVALAGKQEGKCFLLRADMDALPVRERADIDFKAGNGNMHACGHDCHTAVLLGAAELLKTHEAEIEGTVKLMFQPAEETMDGGAQMVEGGVLEDPHVDAAMAGHVLTATPMPVGSLILMGSKTKMAAVDWFNIHVTGKGCHGAMPNTGVDPLNALCHIYLALQTINAREMNPMDNLVLTVGRIRGGETNNVIPNEAQMGGTIRTLSNETRDMVKTRMEAIVTSTAAAFGAEARVEWGSGCPVLTQDGTVYQEVSRYLKTLEGLTVLDLDAMGAAGSGGMGSEDFSHVANRVPSVFVGIPAGEPKDGYVHPQHHPMARFREEGLPGAAAAFAYVAMQWLKEHK